MESLTKAIQDVWYLPKAKIENVQRVGGLTNLNYLATIDAKDYIIRLPGNGTDLFINRQEEKENLMIGTQLGINPELVYFNVETGMKITKKIPQAKPLTKENAKQFNTLKKVTSIFRTLHQSNLQMTNRFELFELMDRFEHLALKANVQFFFGFDEVKGDVMVLIDDYQKMVVDYFPSHIDPACGNFIFGENDKLYLIDWEYSGLFDPLWDLAAYCLEANLTKQEEKIFLNSYFERPATSLELIRIRMHQIFQDYLWTLWTLFKEAKGDDFGQYGQNRFNRVRKNIALFKDVYGEGNIESIS